MALETLFALAGDVVLPLWLLLIFAPRWVWTQRLATFVAPLLLASLYVWLLTHSSPPSGAGFRTLAQVQLLFSSPQALLAGWVHYLAFDLFTGAWEAREAARLEISKWIVAPCLLLTFLFGPVGLALFLLIRLGMRRGLEAR
jgi:hypothetical protein